MYDPRANVPVSIGHDAVIAYGKRFPFTPSDRREREAAIREAKQFGAERQSVMRQQAGRPLSTREQLSGALELPRERPGPKIYSQPEPDPHRNHWRDRLDELRRQAAYTQEQKARLTRRIAFAEKMADEFDSQLAGRKEMPDADIARLRKHAAEEYEQVNRDPKASMP